METLARVVVNRSTAWVIVVTVVLISAVALYLARGVEHEDDVLAFLPQDNPEVAVFSYINKRFGGLDVALVGIQASETDGDVLAPDFLRRLRRVTKELKETKGLDHVLSLANVIDFTPDEGRGGVTARPLVEQIPADAVQRGVLRARVMSRDHVVGNLVSADGEAVLVYCYLAYGTDPKAMAATIKRAVGQAFPSHRAYWGGGPFISTYIYETTQRDMQRLTPWAVLAIVLIMMLSFRDIIGTCLALLSTGMGIVLSLGLMSLLGVRFNIVLSSMPVILFAIGSAYGIHVLSRYYTLKQTESTEQAIAQTLQGIGPTVLAAGLTTVAGLLSFLLMDISPIRTFGLFTALGILFTLLLSLTFIPAVARLVGLKRRETKSVVLRKLMVRLAVFARQHRLAVGLALAVVAAAGVGLTLRVDTRLDHATFFSEGSPPDRAERFLRANFGGSLFIQLHAKGDMTDPHVLRELRLLADRVELMPHVSSVLHVGQAVAQINEIMVGQRRIPDTQAQVRMLYAWLAGDPSVAQLVTADRTEALLHIKVGSNLAEHLEPLLDRLERLVGQELTGRFEVVKVARHPEAAGRLRAITSARILAAAHDLGLDLRPAAREKLVGELSAWPSVAPDRTAMVKQIEGFLRSEECAVRLPRPAGAADPVPLAARALADLRGGASEALVKQTLLKLLQPTPGVKQVAAEAAHSADVDDPKILAEDLALSVTAPLAELRRKQRSAQLAGRVERVAGMKLAGRDGPRLHNALQTALYDLGSPTALRQTRRGAPFGADLDAAPAAGTLGLQVNGLPVMHRGLSRSVTQNQIRSLAFALVVIVVIMAILFRSLWSGLLVATPTMLTLLVIYGGMGLLGVRLDIGTSMLASLILGAGVDYAVHLASAWHAPPDESQVAGAARAADRTGPAIWTNAIMVCAGFFVLTLGEARPLQNVGGLTATAMVVAALATFLVIPVLARRRAYSRNAGSLGAIDHDEVVEAVLDKPQRSSES